VVDWIHHMLKCEFFSTCPRHRDQKKAEVSLMDIFSAQLHTSGPLWPPGASEADSLTV
jgi:hypothetical protein